MENIIEQNSLNRNEKIKIEKRKRHQIYMALNYLRSHKSKFDFFSSDVIQILKAAKELSKNFNRKKLSSELVLLSFFNFDSQITSLLKKFNLSFELLFESITYGYELSDLNKKQFLNFKNDNSWFRKNNSLDLNSKIDLNFEVRFLLEKTIENCYRFKSPIITSEIFFLTLLEEVNTSAGQLLKLSLKSEINWNLLRYEILKMIHNQETKIQGNISKNSHFFAYLLKTELSDYQFLKLLKKEEIFSIICIYRDLVISKLLQLDLFNSLEEEIKYSINLTNRRNYLC
jgi:hypothetical protein